MHPFHDYLCGQLDEMLKKRGIVVFYDPRREFEPFFDRELPETGTGYDGLPRVIVNERLTFLAHFEGSFFALRNAVEPIADLDDPDPLIIYLPGIERDRTGSVLMEIEKGGTTYEPQLRRLALNVLRKTFTDGQIDEMLRPEGVAYDVIVSFLEPGQGGEPVSVLRTLFEGAQSEVLLARWLAEPVMDQAIVAKSARAELVKLLASRLGLSGLEENDTELAVVRARALRYVLVNEFRSDLSCEAPPSVGLIPSAPDGETLERIKAVAVQLRQRHGNAYVELANNVAAETGLDSATIDASCLGSIDTFEFEERALLAHAETLISEKEFDAALAIVEGRRRSFWLDRSVARQAQWEACQLVAELGLEIAAVGAALSKVKAKTKGGAARWVEAYTADDGWYRVDLLQRRLETLVASMDEEPACELALARVRRDHEELIKRMASGFAKALEDDAWHIDGVLPQTRIFSDVVVKAGGPVAYFVIDALRFEMGVDLARQVQGAQDVALGPGIAVLPSITPLGMAALLPGAAADFSVVEYKGKAAARIEGSAMTTLQERLRFLQAKVPDVVDLTLGSLLNLSRAKLRKAVDGASLVLVRSQEIDALGENVDELTARAAMESVIGNIGRAIRKLASAGVENFVVSADHGHQFSLRKEDDMKTDHPGGQTVGVHRRCWIGHGGSTPPGTVRVSGAELGYDTNLDFVFPTGLGVFKTGGGLHYHHGSISLQELVIPVLSLRFPKATESGRQARVAQITGAPERVTNRTFAIQLSVKEQLSIGDAGEGPEPVRVVLIADGDQVGEAGMVLGGTFDRSTGLLQVPPNEEVTVGLLLRRDNCESLRVVVLDPSSDTVLGETDEIPVTLGI